MISRKGDFSKMHYESVMNIKKKEYYGSPSEIRRENFIISKP